MWNSMVLLSCLCCHRSHKWLLYWLPSALCLLSLFQNYLEGVWQKFTSVMAKFGLDWVKFKTHTAVLFNTEVSLSPALQAGSGFWFLSLLLSLWCHSRATKQETAAINIVWHNTVLCTLCSAQLTYNNKPRKVFFHYEAFSKSDLRRGNSCD